MLLDMSTKHPTIPYRSSRLGQDRRVLVRLALPVEFGLRRGCGSRLILIRDPKEGGSCGMDITIDEQLNETRFPKLYGRGEKSGSLNG